MTTSARHPLTALFLGVPDPVSMGIARGWMMAGNRISAIWYPERFARSPMFSKDRELAQRAPGVTLHGLAERAKIPVRSIPRMTSWNAAAGEANALKSDVVLSVLFADKISTPFLDAFSGRVLNLHPSLLPAYRGPSPLFNMIWDRATANHSGLTLHLVSAEFDRGDVLTRRAVPFPANCNVSVYYMELVKAGASVLSSDVPAYLAGQLKASPQADDALAPQTNRRPQDAILVPGQRSADDVAWLAATIPQMTPLRVLGLSNTFRVCGFVSKNGPPTGEPVRAYADRAEFDAADARVTIKIAKD